jgi:prophage regulatory protein
MSALDDLPRERPPAAPTPALAFTESHVPTRREDKPAATSGPRFMRAREVARCAGLSQVTIWRMEREGRFPKRRRISSNAVGWLAEEVENWIRSRADRT